VFARTLHFLNSLCKATDRRVSHDGDDWNLLLQVQPPADDSGELDDFDGADTHLVQRGVDANFVVGNLEKIAKAGKNSALHIRVWLLNARAAVLLDEPLVSLGVGVVVASLKGLSDLGARELAKRGLWQQALLKGNDLVRLDTALKNGDLCDFVGGLD